MNFKREDWNLPNILTLIRILSVPLFIYLLIQPDQLSRFIAFMIFVAASITDLIDGYLARRLNQETELGKFLDPLADKALVIGAFLTFLSLSEQVQLWMVICIIARDFLITGMRYLAIQRGRSLRTSVFGKVKTAFQMLAIAVIIISLFVIRFSERHEINEAYRQASAGGLGAYEIAYQFMLDFIAGSPHSLAYELASFVPYYFMLITTVITIISGIRYLYYNIGLFSLKTEEESS